LCFRRLRVGSLPSGGELAALLNALADCAQEPVFERG
jgi:hypothetical protein